MPDLGYIITISFGKCFGLVTPPPPLPHHQRYDCEAWFEGRKFCVDKKQNGGADSCIIYQTPGRFALLIITSLKEFFVRMFCRSSESSTNSG